MDTNKLQDQTRHVLASVSPYTINHIHLRNPWICAWWSAAFPGLGHVMLCKYVVAFVLIAWEVFINNMSGINTAIYYSMVGDINAARQALNLEWFYFYIPVYIFAIWDSYYRTVLLNEAYRLTIRTGVVVKSSNIDSFELNKLVKRKPVNVIIWSLLAPGLGYLHINRLPAAILFTVWFITIFHYADVLPAVHATMMGDLGAARNIDVQWFLYIPSLYGFVFYDAYAHCVEYNRLFRLEQAAYFRRNYKDSAIMPV